MEIKRFGWVQHKVALTLLFHIPLYLLSFVLHSCLSNEKGPHTPNQQAPHGPHTATQAIPTQQAGVAYRLTLSDFKKYKIEVANQRFRAQQRYAIFTKEPALYALLISALQNFKDLFLAQKLISETDPSVLSEIIKQGEDCTRCLALLRVQVEQILTKEEQLYFDTIQELTNIYTLLTEQIEQMKRAGSLFHYSYSGRMRELALEEWIKNPKSLDFQKNIKSCAAYMYNLTTLRRELAEFNHPFCDLIGKPCILYILCRLLYNASLHKKSIYTKYTKYIESYNLFLKYEELKNMKISNISNRCDLCQQATQDITAHTDILQDIIGNYYEVIRLQLTHQLTTEQTMDDVPVENYILLENYKEQYDKEYAKQIQPLISQIEHCLCQWPKTDSLLAPPLQHTLSSSGNSQIHSWSANLASPQYSNLRSES